MVCQNIVTNLKIIYHILDWLADSLSEIQLKNLRASVQRSSWLWDRYYDFHEYCLAGETYIEKIYWPKVMGAFFIPFQYTTKHTVLIEFYRKKQDEWNTRIPKGSTLPSSSRTPTASMNSIEEANLDNLLE